VHRRRKLTILIPLVIVGMVLLAPLVFPPSGKRPGDQLSPERRLFMQPEQIVELMAPEPGFMVADVGAGCGMFTLLLAQSVGSSGKVYATDVDRRTLAILKRRLQAEGVTNVEPVLVQYHGVDAFYKQHAFDLILAADVIALMQAPEAFFAELRSSLRGQTGRLWIVELSLDPDFTEIEFSNSHTFYDLLRSKSLPETITRRLRGKTREMLATLSPSDSAQPFMELLINDLNLILEDPTLWPETSAADVPLNPEGTILRRALDQKLAAQGCFLSTDGKVSAAALPALRLFNRLIIQDLLGVGSWAKAANLIPLSQEQLAPLLSWLTSGTDLVVLFHNAGYDLVQEYKGLQYCHIWEFKRAH